MSARAVAARLLPAGLVVAAGTWVASGALGDDFRWVGVVGVSELALLSGLRWAGWLQGRPWARLALRLAVAVMAVAVIGAPMPPADVVGWLFCVEGVLFGAWVATRWLFAGDGPGLRRDLRGAGAVAGVGLWFMSVPLPPSGWSPLVGVLVATTALGAEHVDEEKS